MPHQQQTNEKMEHRDTSVAEILNESKGEMANELATAGNDEEGHESIPDFPTSGASQSSSSGAAGSSSSPVLSSARSPPEADPTQAMDSFKASASLAPLGTPSTAPHLAAQPPPPEEAKAARAGASGSGAPSPAQVRDEVRNWLHTKLSNADSAQLQILLNDYDVVKEKTSKLKSLLGRSAKAQREAKVELEATQKRLDASLREIDRLQRKIDKLATRPTHMELLADFESNFDRALLQIGQHPHHHQQAGGQDTAPPNLVPSGTASHGNGNLAAVAVALPSHEDTVVDGLLMQELADSKQRLEKLENLNAALLHRSSQLEAEALERKRERDDLLQRLSHLELEKRMATLEAEQATKARHEVEASLAEMQMEIDLVTKASATASVRAAQDEQLLKMVKSDKQQVQQLEAKVQALQEWALASSEAKNLAQERVRVLETQLRALQHRGSTSGSASADSTSSGHERILFSRCASLVVGAGDVVVRVLTLTDDQARSVKLSERVILRWKFDLTQDDATIAFSLLQSDCEAPAKRRTARHLIQDRWIQGGAAGESENAFIMDNACTLLWSNVKSWIRPKTVKYMVEAVVVDY